MAIAKKATAEKKMIVKTAAQPEIKKNVTKKKPSSTAIIAKKTYAMAKKTTVKKPVAKKATVKKK